jgi:hypothetical protein
MYHTILVFDGSKRAEKYCHMSKSPPTASPRVILLQVIETIQTVDLDYPSMVAETWINGTSAGQAYFQTWSDYKHQKGVTTLIEKVRSCRRSSE